MKKDNRDPTLLGIALGRARERLTVDVSLSAVADTTPLDDVAPHGSPEALAQLASFNGEVQAYFRLPPRP